VFLEDSTNRAEAARATTSSTPRADVLIEVTVVLMVVSIRLTCDVVVCFKVNGKVLRQIVPDPPLVLDCLLYIEAVEQVWGGCKVCLSTVVGFMPKQHPLNHYNYRIQRLQCGRQRPAINWRASSRVTTKAQRSMHCYRSASTFGAVVATAPYVFGLPLVVNRLVFVIMVLCLFVCLFVCLLFAKVCCV
jgi:hypothetical protein